MILFYKTGIFIYSLLIHGFSLFNHKAKLFVKGRKNWQKKLTAKIEKDQKYIWFHCASLGEFEQGRPVIEEIKNQFPQYKIVLTFFSPSGYEIRKNYNLADIIMYLPLDTAKNAKKFIRLVNPEKAFFVKYEYWFFFISELRKQNIPLYIVSAIFRDNQQFFKNTIWGNWYRNILYKFEHFFVQNEKSAKLLESVGVDNCTMSGDTRFDRVALVAKSSKKIPLIEEFKGNHKLIVAGSTWKPDEELLARYINLSDSVKIIIAPHEVTNSNINSLEQMLQKPAIRFSKIVENNDVRIYQVLIIDSIGLLSSLYRYGDISYIGGGFGVGIHNILEAATFGLPVIFGPNYKKFKEAVDLKTLNAAFPVHNYNEFESILNNFLNDNNYLQNASSISKGYVENNVGATKIILNKVFNI